MGDVKRLDIDYYEANGLAESRPGDIWQGLPTFGLFRKSHACGIVITPACDLQNEKVETITYLPVLSLSTYITGVGFVKRVKKELLRSLERMHISVPGLENVRDDFSLPPTGLIEYIENQKLDDGCRDAEVIRGAAALLRGMNGSGASSIENLVAVLGKKTVLEIVGDLMNNRRADVHFLPRDPDSPTFAALADHSVASFRHPITVPLEILQAAATGPATAWEAERRRLEAQYTITMSFGSVRPIKKKRLREAFLKDLITRFSALYTRLGSPDFDKLEIERFISEVLPE